MLIRILLGFSCLLLSLNSFGQTRSAYDVALEDWASVLENHVDDQGRTDFFTLSDNPDRLQRFVDYIATTSPGSHPELFSTPEAVLAYHINAYNALAMHGVIAEDIPDGFTNFFSRARFFKFRKVIIGARETNLYDYENNVIRPLDEPRVHFALNCMVKDCPRLPQTPFTPEKLDQQLDKASREFFLKQRHFYLDHDSKRAYVSQILDFYTKDFVESGKAGDLPEYINRYLEEPIPEGYKVKFIDYDWRINQQPTD